MVSLPTPSDAAGAGAISNGVCFQTSLVSNVGMVIDSISSPLNTVRTYYQKLTPLVGTGKNFNNSLQRA